MRTPRPLANTFSLSKTEPDPAFPLNACRGERCGAWGRTAPIKPVRFNPLFSAKSLKKGVTSGTGSPYLSYTKDANGNTTGWSDAISGKSETLTWDAENRLVSVAQSPANKEFVMVYDGRSRLATIEEKLSGVTQKTTRLIWSGMEICEERDASTGTVLTKYFPDSELQWVGGVYVPSWYYRDHLGSIVETYSGSGALQSQRRFDEWGKMTGTVPGPGASKKGYTGHYQPEGMDYVMAPYRWYSPTTRGWLSRDPIGEAGGVNLYGYVANNPINYIDPTGEIAILIPPIYYGLAALGAAAAGTSAWLNTPEGKAALQDLGNAILDDINKGPFSPPTETLKPKEGSKPKNCPAGTKPIDQSGLSRPQGS